MSASITPFPRTRNRRFIARHAIRMTEMAADKGEAHLHRLLAQQIDTMRRRGIPEDVIASEASAVEAAIRIELWRVVLTPGGAA